MTFTAAEKALTCLLSNADHMAFLHINVPFSAIHTVLLFPVESTTHQFLGRVDKSRVFSFVCWEVYSDYVAVIYIFQEVMIWLTDWLLCCFPFTD